MTQEEDMIGSAVELLGRRTDDRSRLFNATRLDVHAEQIGRSQKSVAESLGILHRTRQVSAPLYIHDDRHTLHENPEEVPGGLETATNHQVVAAAERIINDLFKHYKSGQERFARLSAQLSRIEKGNIFAEEVAELLRDLQLKRGKLPAEFARMRQFLKQHRDGQGSELIQALERTPKTAKGQIKSKALAAETTYDQIIDSLDEALAKESEQQILTKLDTIILFLGQNQDRFPSKPEASRTETQRRPELKALTALKLRHLVAGVLGAAILLTARDTQAQEGFVAIPDEGRDIAENGLDFLELVTEFYGSLESLVQALASVDDSSLETENPSLGANSPDSAQVQPDTVVQSQEEEPTIPPITVQTIGGWTRSAPLLIDDTEVLSLQSGVELTAVTNVDNLSQLKNFQEIDGIPHVVFEDQNGTHAWQLEQQATGFFFLRDTQDSRINSQPNHIWVVVISPGAETPTLMRLDRLNINSFSGGLVDEATPTLTFPPTPETGGTLPRGTETPIEPVGTLPADSETPTPEPTQPPVITPEAAPEPGSEAPPTEVSPETEGDENLGAGTVVAPSLIETLEPGERVTREGFLAGDNEQFWYEDRLVQVPEVLRSPATMTRAETVFNNLMESMEITDSNTGERVSFERGYIRGVILRYKADFLTATVNGRVINTPAVLVAYPIQEGNRTVRWATVYASYLDNSVASVFNRQTNDLDTHMGANPNSTWTVLDNIDAPISFPSNEGTRTILEGEPIMLAITLNADEVYGPIYNGALAAAADVLSPTAPPPTPEMVVDGEVPTAVVPVEAILGFTQ